MLFSNNPWVQLFQATTPSYRNLMPMHQLAMSKPLSTVSTPLHRVWSRFQRMAILSRQSHAGALAIARFHRTDQSWSDLLLVVLGPMAAAPQGTSLDLLETCEPVPEDLSSRFSQFCPLAFPLSANSSALGIY